jgi:hypothetical protein
MNFILEPNELVFFAGRAAILVIALLAFTLAFARWRRATIQGIESLQQALAQSRAEQQATASQADAMVLQLVGRLVAIENKLDTRSQLTAAAASSPRGYELALRLARNGATMEEIAESSGVTRQEATLLVRLHGPRRTA